MQSVAEIRHHIHAVEQTQKITNAMHLISAARMKKLVARLAYNTRYLKHVQAAMRHILTNHEAVEHPYLRHKEEGENTYIVLAGERGMVGAYHADLLKFAHACMQERGQGRLVTFGKTAADYFKKQGQAPEREYRFGPDGPTLTATRHLEQDIFRRYDAGDSGAVYLIHSEFVGEQGRPHIRRLLPLDIESLGDPPDKEELQVHPNPQEMFALLIPQYTVCLLYGALTMTYAGEHSARMRAMQSAGSNADELLQGLRQKYNQARQAAITQEIIEIANAAGALE